LITSPDYYGNIPPLSTLKTLCERAKIPLLIDGAHGGHLHYTKNLHAGTYADMWVDGVHKSLPALTQGAVVSAKTEKYAFALRAAVDIFRTTSPSYPIMASVEYAVKYPKNERLEAQVRAYAKTNTRLQVNEDYTKLCAAFGENAFAAHAYLESKGVYAEFCDGNVICFYLSPATKPSDFKALQRILNNAFQRFQYVELKQVQRIPASYVFDENAVFEWVRLQDSVGRIAAANCGLFPPCTPLVYKGERITKETVSLLEKADNVFGLWQNKISVIQNTKE
jgi:arginine/lysine/ornithine decarboxylase